MTTLARSCQPPRRGRRQRRGLGGVVAAIILVVLLVGTSSLFFALTDAARQQSATALAARGEGKVEETAEVLALRGVDDAGEVAADVSNLGALPLQIVHVALVNNETNREQLGFGDEPSPASPVTVNGGETVRIHTNVVPAFCDPGCDLKAVTRRGNVVPGHYPTSNGIGLPEPVPSRKHVGNLSFDFLTIAWSAEEGGTWTPWSTGTDIPGGAGVNVVWRMNVTNHDESDLWLSQASVVLAWTGGGQSRGFYVIDPSFQVTQVVDAFDESDPVQALIPRGQSKFVYFGANSAGGDQEQGFPGKDLQYALFLLLFGGWDDPTVAGCDLTPATSDPGCPYYGQDLPYKGIRTV